MKIVRIEYDFSEHFAEEVEHEVEDRIYKITGGDEDIPYDELIIMEESDRACEDRNREYCDFNHAEVLEDVTTDDHINRETVKKEWCEYIAGGFYEVFFEFETEKEAKIFAKKNNGVLVGEKK